MPINVVVDVLQIANMIALAAEIATGTIVSAVNWEPIREAYVKDLLETTFNQANKADKKYNVIVVNLGIEYEHDFHGQVFYASALYEPQNIFYPQSIRYGIWVFEYGEFIKRGDGGYINWAFQGNFTRKQIDSRSELVTFRTRI